LTTVCSVEPTPRGPSEVCLASSTPRDHRVVFPKLLMKFQTSSRERLIVTLWVIVVIVLSSGSAY
jgi:hypothetical protein